MPSISWHESRDIRESKKIDYREHAMERIFEILDDAETLPAREVVKRILVEVVIENHLKTSLRKLGNRQKCSLRFFPSLIDAFTVG